MKRIVLVLCLGTAFALGSVAAQTGLHIKPMAAVNLDIGNYFRGFSGGGQVSLNLGGFWIGVEPKVEYDAAYAIAAIPVTLDLGLGDNFWLMAGTTLGKNPSFKNIPLEYKGLLNTFGLGFNVINTDIKLAHLQLFGELTFTNTGTVQSTAILPGLFGNIGAFLLGFQAYVGVALDFTLF